jgi:hypothetical protein
MKALGTAGLCVTFVLSLASYAGAGEQQSSSSKQGSSQGGNQDKGGGHDKDKGDCHDKDKGRCECKGIPGPPGRKGDPGPPGQDGQDGTNGTNGTDGRDGLSAAHAFIGTALTSVTPTDPALTVKIGELTDLPPGNYVVMAKAVFIGSDTGNSVDCTLEAGVPIDRSAVKVAGSGPATVSFLAPVVLDGGGIVLNCVGTGMAASDVKLTAIQVDTLSVVGE